MNTNDFGGRLGLASAISADTNEPNGFVNRTDSNFSKVDGTRTFTISAASGSYDVWVAGERLTLSGSQSVVWTDVEGSHFFYIDATGTLQHRVNFDISLINEVAYIANLYWDAANGVTLAFADERHGIVMDASTHSYLHNVFGTQYVSGLALGSIIADGGGGLDTHAQLAVTDGEIRDEDLIHEIEDGNPQTLDPIAQLPVLYRLGAAGPWRKKTADNFPFIYDGTAGYTAAAGRIPYNLDTAGTWSLAEAGNNQLVLAHIFATNDETEPVVAIQGQAVYANVTAARAGATTELVNLRTDGLPTQEWSPIGTILLQTSGSYGNAVGAQIRTTDDGDDYVDWRSVTLSPGGGTSVGSHNQLTGSSTGDDHLQYVHIDGRRGITGAVATSGTPVTWSVTSGAHTTLANASLAHETHDYSATAEFTGGAATIASAIGSSTVAPVLDAATGGFTVTTAATCAISGAPTSASANLTITNAYALWVQAGDAKFAAAVKVQNLDFDGTSSDIMTLTGATILHRSGTTLTYGYNSYWVDHVFLSGGVEQARINATATTTLDLDVKGNVTIGEDHAVSDGTRTDATRKSGDITGKSWLNAEEDILLLRYDAATAGGVTLTWGGGSSVYNCATTQEFYTATDSTTLTGTLALTINSSQQLLAADGTAALPAYSFASDPDTGMWYSTGSGRIVFVNNTNEVLQLYQGGNQMAVPLNVTTYVQIGDQDQGTTARSNGLLNATDLQFGNTDIAGADLTIRPGIGSGAGDVGQLIFQTPRVEASGTTLQTPVTLMTLDEATVTVAGSIVLDAANPTIVFDGAEDSDTYFRRSGDAIQVWSNATYIGQWTSAGFAHNTGSLTMPRTSQVVLNNDDGSDTYFTSPTSDTISVSVDGTVRYKMTIYNFQSEATNGAAFRYIQPTATTPSFIPNKDASTYGFGSNTAGSNEMTLIGGGSEVQRIGNNQLSFFGAAAVSQQVSGADLTNNVTSGGTDDQIDNWTDLSTYATDAAAIRNAVYQLARKLKQVNDGLRAYNLFT